MRFLASGLLFILAFAALPVHPAKADSLAETACETASNRFGKAGAGRYGWDTDGKTLLLCTKVSTYVLLWKVTSPNCPSGQYFLGISDVGALICKGCPSDQIYVGINNGKLICKGCPDDMIFGGVSPSGALICKPLVGTTCTTLGKARMDSDQLNLIACVCDAANCTSGVWKVMTNETTADGMIACPDGKIMTGISQGQPVCIAPPVTTVSCPSGVKSIVGGVPSCTP